MGDLSLDLHEDGPLCHVLDVGEHGDGVGFFCWVGAGCWHTYLLTLKAHLPLDTNGTLVLTGLLGRPQRHLDS